MKDISQLAGDLSKREAAIKKLNIAILPASGIICVKEIKNNFTKMQGLWKPRSKTTNDLYDYNRTNAYRTPKLHKVSKHKNPYKGSVVRSTNPILLQTRNLRDSVTYKVIGNDVAIGVFHRSYTIGGETHDVLSYARLHNEGGSFKMFGKHTAQMPKRKFMPKPSEGPTATMRLAIRKKYTMELDKIMGSWR